MTIDRHAALMIKKAGISGLFYVRIIGKEVGE